MTSPSPSNYPHGQQPRGIRDWPHLETYLRGHWDAFETVRKGKLDCIGEVTLTAGAASTTYQHHLLAAGGYIGFDPLSANAAAELAAGTMYVLEANRSTGSYVITHANNGQTDRKFRVAILGG